MNAHFCSSIYLCFWVSSSYFTGVNNCLFNKRWMRFSFTLSIISRNIPVPNGRFFYFFFAGNGRWDRGNFLCWPSCVSVIWKKPILPWKTSESRREFIPPSHFYSQSFVYNQDFKRGNEDPETEDDGNLCSGEFLYMQISDKWSHKAQYLFILNRF